MARKNNIVEASVEVNAIAEVTLTDEQILKASAEIWNENPTKFMGDIIAYASQSSMDDNGFSLNS